MIPAFACLLLPFAGDCSAFVRNAPKITDVALHQQRYTGKTLNVRGRVEKLAQWNSKRSGLPQEVFVVCDGACVQVYMQGRSPIHDGQTVNVRGVYYDVYRVGRSTFHNEIEATEVLPRD